MTRWTSRTISFLAFVLAARPEIAAANDCRRSGAEIVCKAEGFDLLVRELLEARAAASQCGIALEARVSDLSAQEAELNACRAAGAGVTPTATTTKAVGSWKPIVALALGIAGTAGAALALASDAPTGARIGLGVGGAVALAGGVVVALP